MNRLLRRKLPFNCSGSHTRVNGAVNKWLYSTKQFEERIEKELEAMKQAGTFKTERMIASPQAAVIKILDREGKKKPVLNFCANNYLGLANNARLVEAAKLGLDKYGVGMASVRFICGTLDLHRELEEKLAKFHGMEAAVLYSSCFDANAGLFEAILGEGDVIISDALNHASIIDGIRLCKASRIRYQHNNMKDLEQHLKDAKDKYKVKLVATDGVFSMDGELARLDEISRLAHKYDALVFVDDCHGTGVMGKSGKGTNEHFGTSVDIINSTLGKALGGAAGGYTVAKKPIISMLRQRSRPYLFSNTLSPVLVAVGLAAIDCITPEVVEKLGENVVRFRRLMKERGFELMGDANHPIAPVMVGDARIAHQMADRLLQEGIYAIGFSYPVVPKGLARIRTQVSAIHTADQLELAVDAFAKVAKEYGVIGK